MAKKALLVPVTLAQHTKFKWKCQQLGISMSQAIRVMVDAFINETTVTPESIKAGGHLPAEWQKERRDSLDIYDELAERTKQVLGDGMHPVNQ